MRRHVWLAMLLLAACNQSQTGMWYVPDPPGYAQRKADQAKCLGYGYELPWRITACIDELAERRRDADRQAEFAAADDAACRGHGLAPGSTAYDQCRSALAQARIAPAPVVYGAPLPEGTPMTCIMQGGALYCH